MSDLRARIEDAYDEGVPAPGSVAAHGSLGRAQREARVSAILAALTGVDSDEVAEVLTAGIESGDIDRAVRDVRSFYHLIRKGGNDDD